MGGHDDGLESVVTPMHAHTENLCFLIGLPMTLGGFLLGNLFAMILGALLVGYACLRYAWFLLTG